MAIGRPSKGRRETISLRIPVTLLDKISDLVPPGERNDMLTELLERGLRSLERIEAAKAVPPSAPAPPLASILMRGSQMLANRAVVPVPPPRPAPVFDASLDDDDEPELWTIDQIRDASRLARKIGWRGSPEELLHETDGDLRGIGQGDFDPTPEQQALNARLAAKMRGRK